jgi:hypothetical protein
MANRYWVGGSAQWNATAGTKWAFTSNGSGGAPVPTIDDDVFFDVNSSNASVSTSSSVLPAKSINCTGFTGTITLSGTINVAGNVTLSSGMTWVSAANSLVTFTGSGTLTTAGKSFSAIEVNGSGITVTLGDALSMSGSYPNGALTVTRGTFNTANYNVTGSAIVSSNSNTRTINLGSSTVTLSHSTPVDLATTTNLTFNAGTSQITASSSNPTFNGGGLTFYNVSFTYANTGAANINGANTFNNLSITANGTGLNALSISANQTVNGTLTCAGASATQRGFVRSSVLGTSRTITVATLSANDSDFRDITIAGSAAGGSPTRAGDCGNNSGITFPAAKTVYRVGTNTTWSGSSSWALSSGASGSNNNFPLPQDTAVINNDTTLSGTLSFNSTYNIGTVDCSNRTTAITLNYNNAQSTFYGSHAFGSGVTSFGTVTQRFSGRGTQTFTSAGKTITFPILVEKPVGAFELGDAFSSSSGLELTAGTLNAKNYNVSCAYFALVTSAVIVSPRTLTMGSGLWTLTGANGTGYAGGAEVWSFGSNASFTLNKDTANILLSNTSTSSRTFNGPDGAVYNKLTIGGATGASTTTIGASNKSYTFSELASTKTVTHTISFAANQTITKWTVTGTSGNIVTVNSTSAGVRRTITLINATSSANDVNYLSVKDIGVTDANKFYVGANSTNGGNNLNVIFMTPPAYVNPTTPTIRIKRSSTSGDPTTLAAGELAYSALENNGSNGGDILYIGMGTETSGNAANHFVIGGKYFTDMMDHTKGVLTASSALIADSSSKLDNLKVDNLDLNGNTVSSTDANGDLFITPNGTGKTVITNPYIGNNSTSLSEFILDTVGGVVTAGTGITVTNSDVNNTSTIAISSAVVTLTGTQTLSNKTLVAPVLGAATATSINKLTITAPATGSTLTIADGKTLTANNTLTFTGTDTSSVAFGAGGTVAYTSNKLSAFAATTSSELAGIITDETGSGSLVFANSPTLVSPTLGAALATSITATSGSLTIAAETGDNSVNLVPTGTGTVDVASKRITNVAEPTQATDVATKSYVDDVKTGLIIKDAVRAATTAALTAAYSNGTSGVGATLTNSGTQAALVVDGVSLVANDRVLVKNQADASENGIYVVTNAGSVSTDWVLTRAADFDQSPAGEIEGGDFTFVQEGTANADSGFVVTTNGAITVGTTGINWAQFSGAGSIAAGDGLTKDGNTLNVVGTADRITTTSDAVDIASTYVGQSSITTLGTISTGTWQADIINPAYGGTGVNNGSSAFTLGGNLTTSGAFNTTLTVTANTSLTLPVTGTIATLDGTESLSNKTITASSFDGTTLSASGNITFTNTTDATALGTAPVVMSGGLSVAKAMFVGTNITGAGAATSTLDGFVTDGGTY